MKQLVLNFIKIPSDFTPNYQRYHLQEVAERDRRIAELENEVRAGKRSKRTCKGWITRKSKNK